MNAWRMALGLMVCMCLNTASAHDARPVTVRVTEQQPLQYLVRIQPPDSLAVDQHPVLVMPSDCRQIMGALHRCEKGLGGRTLGLMYPGTNPSLATFFRFESRAGKLTSMLLGPNQRTWQVPETGGGVMEVFTEYLVLGVQHIAVGADHLLFVVCLVILAWRGESRVKRLLITITGFTLAHSLTLALSVLDIVRVPVVLVEALIALSILFLAAEILREGDSLTRRYPVMVATAFGLLHGFGFAAVLREIGLPDSQLLTGLLAFNLGVEVGQVLFISAILVAAALIGRSITQSAASTVQTVTAYGTGTLASFWMFERTFAFWL